MGVKGKFEELGLAVTEYKANKMVPLVSVMRELNIIGEEDCIEIVEVAGLDANYLLVLCNGLYILLGVDGSYEFIDRDDLKSDHL